MPNIDEDAKRWQLDVAGRVGREVRRLRDDVLGITATELAERCRNLGFPISRVAIAKIEANSRAGKLDLSELLILARALDVSPAQLTFPDLPKGKSEMLPGVQQQSWEAIRWFSGESGPFARAKGFTNADGVPVEAYMRVDLDPRADTVGVTRDWMEAALQYRRARELFRNEVSESGPSDRLAALQSLMEAQRENAKALIRQMEERGMDIAEGDYDA